MRILAGLSFLAWLGASAPCFAHAFLSHADPAAGARLAKAPAAITLDFTEELEPAFSGASVVGPTGQEFATATKVEGGTITVALAALKPGKYVVHWHAVSVDAHRTQGAYSFVVAP
ncbi:MAG: copper resistance protein CopC [Alphaproteobacteria bacterium]|nr:copper resistance protein CopC [Alphaproteobacteria bacterium]MBV9693136.1 copper resistance protein CopC [Alphaproteobacteria bacterium]